MAFNTHTSKQDVWEIFANYKVFREDYIYIFFFICKNCRTQLTVSGKELVVK